MRFKLKANGKTYEVVTAVSPNVCHSADAVCAARYEPSNTCRSWFGNRCVGGKWHDRIFVEVPSNG